MKHLKIFSLFLITLFTLNLSCSKDDDTSKEQEQQSDDFTTVDIKVVLPEGSRINLTNYKVRSVVDDFDIVANGSSTANLLQDQTGIAYVVDANNNPILAGFINNEKREISVRSTVEVAIFYNLGTIFQPYEIRELYIKEISNGLNIDELVANSESIFATNNALIGQQNFLEVIQSNTDEFGKDLNVSNKTSKAKSGLDFDENSWSGISLVEEAGNNILFKNTQRRRAHAFFYKTVITKEENPENPITLINNIPLDDSKTSIQMPIPPTTSVTSVIGVLQTVFSGKGQEMLSVNSDPTTLQLTDDLVKATYKARLIGPGLQFDPSELTSDEFDKLSELTIETFAMDILLPIIGTALGHADSPFSNLNNTNSIVPYIDGVKAAIGAIDGANEAVKKGDLAILLSAFLDGFVDGTGSAVFEPFLKGAANLILSNAETTTTAAITNNLDKLFATIKMADFVLQGIDLLRISGAIASSNSVETFKIDVKRGIVILRPGLSTIKKGGDDLLLTVEILDQNLGAGQAFEYVFTSTGEYGVLVATNKNETNATKITTSVNTIKYRAEDGGDGEDGDVIKVEVFIKEGVNRTRVDDDVAIVNIVGSELKINPNNATISGGTGLNLSVVDNKGNNITESTTSDYSFTWRTSGAFGMFNGISNTLNTQQKLVRYEALETTKTGTENISVSVYRRTKGGNEEFKFLQTIEGNINIAEPCTNEEESIMKASINVEGNPTRPFESRNTSYYANIDGEGSLLISARTEADGTYTSASITLRTFNYKGVGTYPIGKASLSNLGWDASIVFNETAHWRSEDPPSGTITITEECATYIKGTFNFTARLSTSTIKAEITNGNFVINR